jgi:hypothetical protein
MLVLETTIRKEEKVTKTLPIPYYCFNEDKRTYYQVLDNDNVISVTNGLSTWINKTALWLNKSEIAEAKEITYHEFEIELNKAIDSIKSSVAA